MKKVFCPAIILLFLGMGSCKKKNTDINVLEPFSNCSLWTAQQKADLNSAIAAARADLADACN
jgi:hypothetical protein